MKRIITGLLKSIGTLMFILWMIHQSIFYAMMWGFWGWFIGAIFFIPLTPFTLYLFAVSGQWTSVTLAILFNVVMYVLVCFS
jgi:hypothetical protein